MDEDFESELYEQDPPEWVERSDDYNVFEERQLDADRDAGEGRSPEADARVSVAGDLAAFFHRWMEGRCDHRPGQSLECDDFADAFYGVK